MVIIASNNDASYGISCIRCKDCLIAPDCSKYVSEDRITHSWSCESCGHEFETAHRLDFTKSLLC